MPPTRLGGLQILDGSIQTVDIEDNAITDAKVASGIAKSKVGLGNVDNTSDVNKPISTITQTALNNKIDGFQLTNILSSKRDSTALLSTGIIFGGYLTISNLDNTKIDISSGAGYVVNDTVTPATSEYVEWNAFEGIDLTDRLTQTSTDIAINLEGIVLQQRSYSNIELRSVIFLGGIDHSGGTVNNTFSVQIPSFAPALSIRDLAKAVGDLNLSGNTYFCADANLQISKTVGQAFSFGRNTSNNKNDPHTISQAAIFIVSFNYIYQNGVGGTNVTAATTSIDTLSFDNGTGTLGTVPINNFGLQNILIFPNANKTFIQYGAITYAKLEDAIAGLSTTTFPTLIGFGTAVRRGVIIVKKGALDLSNSTQARFFVADKFGAVAGAVGAGANAGGDMLASIYDPTGIASNIFNRTNHTGNQLANTISDFNSAVLLTSPTETIGTLQNKRPLKTIEGQSLEGYGDVDLTKSDVGLGQVDNIADLFKPISSATQSALNLKENSLPTQTGNSGKYLKTDGVTVLWDTFASGGGGGNSYTTSTKTVNYTETAISGTTILLANTTNNSVTITLPTAIGNTSMIVIKKIAILNQLIINPGNQTIDGGSVITITRLDESITIISNNVNWLII